MVLGLLTAHPTGPRRLGAHEARILVTRAGDGKKICEAIVYGRDVRWIIEPPAPVRNLWKIEMWNYGARAHNTFDALEMIAEGPDYGPRAHRTWSSGGLDKEPLGGMTIANVGPADTTLLHQQAIVEGARMMT